MPKCNVWSVQIFTVIRARKKDLAVLFGSELFYAVQSIMTFGISCTIRMSQLIDQHKSEIDKFSFYILLS